MAKRSNQKARKIYEEYLKCKIPNGHEIHHIIPVDLGGTDDIENLLLMHRKDHQKVTLCYNTKFPTNEQIIEASKALKYWMSVKESKNIPKPESDELSVYQRFMVEHKDELHIIKIAKRLSNPEIVEYEPFKDKIGTAGTFNHNWRKLGWNPLIWDDRLNGIFNQKRSQAMKGKNHHFYGKTGEEAPFYGKNHTEETKQKQSEANKGKKVSEETKQKIGEANKGKEPWNKDKPRSQETKDKIAKAKKGKTITGEPKEKRYERWLIAEKNGETKQEFCDKEKIHPITLRRLIKEFGICSETSLN